MLDVLRLRAAYEIARDELLAGRTSQGYWEGRLASSALSTATAVSALAVAQRESDLIARGVKYLAEEQNADGGWGDTDRSLSNVATTMLVQAAFRLSGTHQHHAAALGRARDYIAHKGGVAGLRRRYGKDKTFAAPILTNCALAGLTPWSEVSPLPFELACLPQGFYRFLRLPVVSYAIPALVAIGQARFFHKKPLNPITRVLRSAAINKSLDVLERMQPESGGFLEATPLTSFVVMSLAGSGRAGHPVVRRGVKFLLNSVREDGSWPIDSNLATWNTTLAVNALGGASHPTGLTDWLLSCQHHRRHPYTGAEPGGWAWTDLSGGVPDVDDTSGALLALRRLASQTNDLQTKNAIEQAATSGVKWLLDTQNSNGGWPTFCRGWGTMPFDRSATDLTAHALRALLAWGADASSAVKRGLAFLEKSQQDDGSWRPLWFGNQHHPREENPIYGTARVLLALRDYDRLDTPAAQRGLKWLANRQNPDGGWGSVEETALAVEALLSGENDNSIGDTATRGIEWLFEAVESGRFTDCSPIGFYFAKLWYYEKLYPIIFTVSALGQAVRRFRHKSVADDRMNAVTTNDTR